MKIVDSVEDAHKYVLNHIENLNKEIESLKQQRELEKPKQKNLISYEELPSHLRYELHKLFLYTTDPKKVLDEQFEILDKHLALIEQIHTKNLEIIEHNKKVIKCISDFMDYFDIKSKYWALDPKSRARFPKKQYYDSGYIHDCNRHIPTQDMMYIAYKNQILNTKKSLQTLCDNKLAEIKEKELEQAKIKAEEERNFLRAEMILTYNLSKELQLEDILEYLLSTNKYLNIAHNMLRNRNDWNEGYSYVEDALMSFKVENAMDKQIYDCLSDIIDNNDGYIDGRSFRDCEWNYDRIFSFVNETSGNLYKDYERIIRYIQLD